METGIINLTGNAGIKQGATKRLRFVFPFSLTGMNAIAKVKLNKQRDVSVSAPQINWVNRSFVEPETNETKGIVELFFPPNQTQLLCAGVYWWEFWLIMPSGDRFCALAGEIEVTR